ncbi:glycosyl transferase family 2 [Solidesulfovibrio carbinoliphilus subsp. oakridgensis]|uniref:Glycosyl transferase family 2 n=1 Tax=Solidesulfovibrio carbinoliphilus subsp. oakridgensis TaxID=694327 RepID=G7Q872_9BACT|nr:glycosyltransferase family 2 protein [Solidesulfovibrio carbinoliphilus]EHJ48086.1 glycosyl transferase family 2 [Solidesulfovibrio carbinoliphilus subsp. oakridgensis]
MPEQPEITPYPPPARLQRASPLLAFGLEGPWLARHLAATLASAAAKDPVLAGTARALAAWNFERAPLDPAFAAPGLAAARQAGDAPRRRALCAALARRLSGPAGVPDAGDWPALRDSPDPEAGLAFLRPRLADPAGSLFWPGRAFAFALTRGLPDLGREVIERLGREPDPVSALGPRLAAEAAFAWDGPAAGLAALHAVDAVLFPRFHGLALAHGLAETGERQAAAAVLASLWRAENWHPGLTLRLDALTRPKAPASLDALPGRLFVFLYSFNRAGLLAATLESLAASRLGPARIVVLDNGGTDGTAAVCRAFGERLGPDRFEALRLPANIGAPAARNWLAAVSNLGPDDLAAYVDDDVTLPPDWLELLAGALLADPLADVAGARIVTATGPAAGVVQAADVRLLPPDAANTVRPLVNHGNGPDFGLLATTRPCPSVSGCCHLFRGKALAGPAPFDIRFSPSQFDDLARDLGGFLAGRRAVYVGSLAVRHHQHAGPAQARNQAAVGQLLGARAKLDGLFGRSAMTVAASRDADTAFAAWEETWRTLRDTV